MNNQKITIIGGGIMGLTLAYNLHKLGFSNVTILDKSYLTYGASGRCGGGVREQWGTEENIKWMHESMRFFENFATKFKENIWFRQDGYLFLAKTNKQKNMLEKSVAFQNKVGVKSRLIDPQDINKFCPHIKTDDILLASYNSRDGVLFPWPVLFGLEKYLKDQNIKVHTFTPVTGLKIQNEKIVKVVAKDKEFESDLVINATGAWAKELCKLSEIHMPNKPIIHEILVTEPLKPFINPCIADLKSSIFMAQTLRGEVIVCKSSKNEIESLDFKVTLDWLRDVATELTHLLPIFKEIKILRHWSGCYDITPDAAPILGPVKQIPNFIQAHGFMGHGFMMAPAIGRILAEYINDGSHNETINKYSVERFKSGGLDRESFIIG